MVELHVEGMSCNHCVSSVTKSIIAIDRAATVEVDLKTNTVRVDSNQSIDAIQAAVIDAGYAVTAAKAV